MIEAIAALPWPFAAVVMIGVPIATMAPLMLRASDPVRMHLNFFQAVSKGFDESMAAKRKKRKAANNGT